MKFKITQEHFVELVKKSESMGHLLEMLGIIKAFLTDDPYFLILNQLNRNVLVLF